MLHPARVPARDGDAAELERLLELSPWTVDEPGREGQHYTNALQVACASGHPECVRLLLDAGAIFRDSNWSPNGHQPYVCASMLAGAGYTAPPEGSDAGGSATQSRVPREIYIQIIDMLLDPSTSFCNGQADRDLLTKTKETMEGDEPSQPEVATGSPAPSAAVDVSDGAPVGVIGSDEAAQQPAEARQSLRCESGEHESGKRPAGGGIAPESGGHVVPNTLAY